MSIERESTCGERLEFVFTNMIGHVVLVHTLDGAQWEGIFVSRTDEAKDDAHTPGDYFLLSEVRNRQSAVHAGQDASIVLPHLAVAAQDIVYLETSAIRIEAVAHGRVEPFRSSPLTEITQDWSEFPVEPSLGGAKGISLAGDLETEERAWVAGKWDQFEANKKFGVVSTYSEDQYTTKLDKTKFTREQVALADRLSQEIERSQARGGIQHRIERGEEVEGDEGALYSDVGRTKPGAATSTTSPSTPQPPSAMSASATTPPSAASATVVTSAGAQQAGTTGHLQMASIASGRAPMPIEEGLSASSLSSDPAGRHRARVPPPPLAPLAVVATAASLRPAAAGSNDACFVNLLCAVGQKLDARSDTRRCLPDWPGEGDSYDIETSDFKKTAEEVRHVSMIAHHHQHPHHHQQHHQQQQGHANHVAHHHHQLHHNHGSLYAQQMPTPPHARAHPQHQLPLHHGVPQHGQQQQHAAGTPPLPPPQALHQQAPSQMQPSGYGGGPHHLMNWQLMAHHSVSAPPPAPPPAPQHAYSMHMPHETMSVGASHVPSSAPASSASTVSGLSVQQPMHHVQPHIHNHHHQQNHLHHHHHAQHHLHHAHHHSNPATGSLSAPPQLLAPAQQHQHALLYHHHYHHHHHHQHHQHQLQQHHSQGGSLHPGGYPSGSNSSGGSAPFHHVHRAQSDGPRPGRNSASIDGASGGSSSSGATSGAVTSSSRTQPQQPIPTGSFAAASASTAAGYSHGEGSPLTPPPAAMDERRGAGHSALQRGAKGLHRLDDGSSSSNLPSPGSGGGTRPTTSPSGTPQRGGAAVARGGRPTSPPVAAPPASLSALGGP